MVLTAIGIDIMLPAFAEVRQHFAISAEKAQTSRLISFFFMGQVTQILFGYLSDKKGRLPVLRSGIVLYILSGFAVVVCNDLGWMLFFRFTAGMGAAAVFMSSIASVRDQYSGNEMARVMSFVLSIFLFTPIVAPALGSFILHWSSWQFVFAVPPLFAVVVWIWSFRMKESHPMEKRSTMKWHEIFLVLKSIFSDRHFLRYTTIATLIFSILSSYVASSESIIGEIYLLPTMFPVIFGSIGLLMAIFSFGNSMLARKIGAKKSLRVQLSTYFIISLLLFICTRVLGDPPPVYIFFAAIGLLMALTTAADPNSSAIALEFLGEKAGLAAAVYGTIFFFVGSSIGAIISLKLVHGVMCLIICATIFSGMALILVFMDKAKFKV